ncbi:hypothetical protein [Cupriavidus nantongensis]|uniref:Uncharacterized protein n=1 Tax=Cupriavidus nantongensis TaxID=1796606 RepID=A0A142JGU9_9BURK|nr:hypothetical protein [Cupriavidus nantongensis]AMR77311.1 hypothetical protein A2G96_05945 [Cupriavidus nantongensis]
MSLEFEKKITLGNVLTMASMLVATAVAYANYRADITAHEVRIDALEKSRTSSDQRIDQHRAEFLAQLRDTRAEVKEVNHKLDRLIERGDNRR